MQFQNWENRNFENLIKVARTIIEPGCFYIKNLTGFLIYRTWLGYFMGCARGLLFLSQKREERSGSPPQERDRSLLLN
jgi:hypothetical protein